MKKILSFSLLILMLASLSLSSCTFLPTAQQNNPQPGTQPEELSATEVMDSIIEKMDRVNSYEAEGEQEIIIYANSKKMTIDASSQTIVVQEADSYFYNYGTMTMTYDGIKIDAESIEAFDGENYFYSYTYDGKRSAFYSELSSAEFDSFYELTSENKSVLNGYKQISHVKTADGRYIVTLEKYDKRTVDVANSLLGLPAEDGGGRISDIKVSIEADADFYIDYVTVEYIFTDDSFSGKEVTSYKKYGTAQKNWGNLDKVDYKEVSDARALQLYINLLIDRQLVQNGEFSFFTAQAVTVAGNRTTQRETDRINYGFDDDGYYFDVDANVNGQEINVSYKGVTYQINGNVQNDTDYTDDTARTFINGLIDPFGFTSADATDITTYQQSSKTIKYSIVLDSVNGKLADEIRAIYSNAGAVYSNADIVFSFTVRENEIIYTAYKIQSTGFVIQGNQKYDMTLNIETSADFFK
ncbi:MAG: hypothetical protein E7587_09485 [Ruminococcaceae bacterium]|nr:hypothetical protein [Oscillospiraceae bacterium]